MNTFAINIMRHIDKTPTTGVSKVETIQLFFSLSPFFWISYMSILLIPSNDIEVNPDLNREFYLANWTLDGIAH